MCNIHTDCCGMFLNNTWYGVVADDVHIRTAQPTKRALKMDSDLVRTYIIGRYGNRPSLIAKKVAPNEPISELQQQQYYSNGEKKRVTLSC